VYAPQAPNPCSSYSRLADIQSIEELYDPIINVISAKRLYDEQGLGAWGAYTDNSYKDF
jgi:hypothetical protein